MGSKKIRSRGDVQWTFPGKRRPFAYSTVAQMDLISDIGQQGYTFEQALKKILFDPEALRIVEQFNEAGFGKTLVREMVR